MKKNLLVLLIILLLASCKTSRNETEQIEEFYAVFDPKQREAFELAVESFDSFLEINFNEHKTLEEKLQTFLQEIMDSTLYKKWQINMDEGREVLLKYEESGLRKEIWMYGFEFDEELFEEQIIPPGSPEINYDSLIEFVHYGKYIRALVNIRFPDSLVVNYTDAIDIGGLMSPNIVATGMLYEMKRNDYNPEILKRIIIAEFYFGLLQNHSPI